MSHETIDTKIKESRAIKVSREIVFGSKWVLVPFYLGLVVIQVMYAVKYIIHVYGILPTFMSLSENETILCVLSFVDMVMIANLIRTIISGSYHAFIDRNGPSSEHISSGYLKVKTAMSLVGVSAIHLLQTFINSESLTTRDIIVKCSIHGVFLLSTICLAFVEYLHEKSNELKST